MTPITFQGLLVEGPDAQTFLQGQLTLDVLRATERFAPCAICNLKGRIDFGLWAQKTQTGFCLVIVSQMLCELKMHLQKYAAFSKVTLNDAGPYLPTLTPSGFDFCPLGTTVPLDTQDILAHALTTYTPILHKKDQGLYQPQALHLHKKGGVHYDKGCYLGQEIVARVYFRGKPKGVLLAIEATDEALKTASLIPILSLGEHHLVVTQVGAHLNILPPPAALLENIKA